MSGLGKPGRAPILLGPLHSRETYRSQIFFGEDDVWKLKKPVRVGLVDYSTLEARREACDAELRLNRRFAPDVYLGLVAVTESGTGERQIGGDGEPVDWAIHMRRLADADRLDERLATDRLGDAQIQAIAERLAVRHHAARSDESTAAGGSTQALRALIDLEIGQPSAEHGAAPEHPAPLPREAERAASWQRTFLMEQESLFAERTLTGRVREGHGALSLDRIFVSDEGRVDIIDCVEFDDRLRQMDVCGDVAFLATCLAAEHRSDLAERFLAHYATHANDFDLYRLVDFYSSLRASLRGKSEWFYADAFRADPRSSEERRQRARQAFLLALAAPRKPLLPPVVVAMGGQVASGKSTVARAIASQIGAPFVSSDATREFLLGASPVRGPHETRWEQAYEPGFGARVYTEVARRAEAVLQSGRPVVLDGCFRSAEQRAVARSLAQRFGHPFLFVEARVPRDEQRKRLHARAVDDGVPDRDWLEIADELRASWEPADELDEAERSSVDTSQPLEDNLRELRTRLPSWPDGLTG